MEGLEWGGIVKGGNGERGCKGIYVLSLSLTLETCRYTVPTAVAGANTPYL
jgi:hypothetical protein